MKTKTLQDRLARLMPAGVPRYIRAYDNGGETADRYTVCFTGRAATIRVSNFAATYPYLVMSAAPFHPLGIGLHGEMQDRPLDTRRGWAPPIGRKCHLGRRIRFQELPEDCRRLVLSDYREIWRLNPEGSP